MTDEDLTCRNVVLYGKCFFRAAISLCGHYFSLLFCHIQYVPLENLNNSSKSVCLDETDLSVQVFTLIKFIAKKKTCSVANYCNNNYTII